MRSEFNFLHRNFFSGTFLDSSKAARRKLRCVPRGPYLDRFNPGSFHPCCCFKTAPRFPRYLCFAAADFIRRNCRAPRPAGGFAYAVVPLRKQRTDTIDIRKRRKAPALPREKIPSVFLGLPLSLPITFSEPNSHPPLNSSLPRWQMPGSFPFPWLAHSQPTHRIPVPVVGNARECTGGSRPTISQSLAAFPILSHSFHTNTPMQLRSKPHWGVCTL